MGSVWIVISINRFVGGVGMATYVTSTTYKFKYNVPTRKKKEVLT
jgi:hypothetical protein